MLKIWRSPDNTKAPPPVVIQIGNQTLIGLLIDRLGANLISRVAGRDDGNARVDNFFRSDRALETSGPEGGGSWAFLADV